jgi:hypothetical protein
LEPGAPRELDQGGQRIDFQLVGPGRQTSAFAPGDIDDVHCAVDQRRVGLRPLEVGDDHFRGCRQRFRWQLIGLADARDNRDRRGAQIPGYESAGASAGTDHQN